MDTFKEYFLGNKELFQGTFIYDKIEENKIHPIILLDFANISYKELGLKEALAKKLKNIGHYYGIVLEEKDYVSLFYELILKLFQKNKVVVLVDEYDKPIIDYMENLEKAEENREILKNFFGQLKSHDAHLEFLFLTGVAKFTKVSIFSDLNHLTDLTTEYTCVKLLGYTEEEIKFYFKEYLEEVMQELKISESELLNKMEYMYNGYSWDGNTFVYNPYSVLSFLRKRRFDNYWYEKLTPTFLIKYLKQHLKIPTEISPVSVNNISFNKFDFSKIDIISLLFQTGYLTIKKEDLDFQEYTLAFPNKEVEISFLTHILDSWVGDEKDTVHSSINALKKHLYYLEPEKFMETLKVIFASISYDYFLQKHAIEALFASNIYIILKMLAAFYKVEVHVNEGRMDGVVEVPQAIYIFEFKMESSSKAMTQIEERNYAHSYLNSS